MSVRLRLERLAAALKALGARNSHRNGNGNGNGNGSGHTRRRSSSSSVQLPSKLLVTGGGSANPGILAVLSSVLGATVLGKAELSPADEHGQGSGTTSSALGAAKKARWAWGRDKMDGGRHTFEEWEAEVEAMRERLAAADGRGRARPGSATPRGRPSQREMDGKEAELRRMSVDEGSGLIVLARPEQDQFEYYASLLAEHERLSSAISRGLL